VDRHFGETAVPEGQYGPQNIFELYPGIRLTTEVKSQKSLTVEVAKKFRAKQRCHDSLCRPDHHFTGGIDWSAEPSHSLLPVQVTLVKLRSLQLSAELSN
jgi:hypothetical protein